MSVLGVLLLTTAIGIEASRSPSSNTEDAYKALGKATYVQTGTDKAVKRLEKRYTPRVVKEYGGWIAGIVKVVQDQKISFEWTF